MPRTKKQVREFEMLGGAAMLVTLIFVGFFFLVTSLQSTLMSSPQVAAVVSATLVDLTNGDRAANNLPSLKVNPELVAIAQAKANDMALKGYFSHTTPEGHDPWYWFKRGGYSFEYAGENLAVDFTESMDVERAWMNSATHRKNILDSNFTEIGIATAVGTYQGRSTIFVAQMFGKPSGTAQQPQIAREVVPESPRETAVARAEVPVREVVPEPVEAVLGEAAMPEVIQPAVAAELAVEMTDEKPFWSGVVSSPRETLRNVYVILALLVLLGLAFDTGLEIRRHHRGRALRAGAVLAVMAVLFTFAELFYFVEPVVALAV